MNMNLDSRLMNLNRFRLLNVIGSEMTNRLIIIITIINKIVLLRRLLLLFLDCTNCQGLKSLKDLLCDHLKWAGDEAHAIDFE